MANLNAGSHALGNTRGGTTGDRGRGRTPAPWYCLLGGLALLLAGIFGFLADATFDTGSSADTDANGNADGMLQGDSFLGFEVNGWHNVVHILSGVVLLAAASRAKSARTVSIAFGAVYGLVAIIGLIDGNDVLGFIPVNAADNLLHIALSAVGIIAGLVSRGYDLDDHRAGRGTSGGTVGTTTAGTARSNRFDRETHAPTLERETDEALGRRGAN